MNDATRNVDPDVAAGFGHEWSTFRQSKTELASADREAIFRSYFDIFPWHELPRPGGHRCRLRQRPRSVMAAPKVRYLHLLDANPDAHAVAKTNLARVGNVSFHPANVGDIPLDDSSLNFAFSLGVLHTTCLILRPLSGLSQPN